MRPQTRRRLLFLAFVGALALASALDPNGLGKHLRLAGEARRVEGENRELGVEIARLRREAKALAGDSSALERAAREELGYVRSGELVFKLEGEGSAP
jgi:cell division protein FtsB